MKTATRGGCRGETGKAATSRSLTTMCKQQTLETDGGMRNELNVLGIEEQDSTRELWCTNGEGGPGAAAPAPAHAQPDRGKR